MKWEIEHCILDVKTKQKTPTQIDMRPTAKKYYKC